MAMHNTVNTQIRVRVLILNLQDDGALYQGREVYLMFSKLWPDMIIF